MRVGIPREIKEQEYRVASIADDAAAIFAGCDLIVKVKEPQPDECGQLRPGQILFIYLRSRAGCFRQPYYE